ncbi:hypothetical protein PSY19_24230, partial [Shigella flexneri]|nr:hypothetical protein [Shigella flexneri]
IGIAEDTGKINYGVVLFCMPDKVFTPHPALRILPGSRENSLITTRLSIIALIKLFSLEPGRIRHYGISLLQERIN